MTKKLIVILILAISILGFWFYFSHKKAEITAKLPDEPAVILQKLKSATGLNFSQAAKSSMPWNMNNQTVDTVTISALRFDVSGITPEQENKIYGFFTDNGFVLDPFNVADATITSLKGYKKDNVVCVITNGFDVDVRCGKLSDVVTKEDLCISSGGQVATSSCCIQTEDFPNLCAIGACGCSPNNSHETKICNCGEGKCFNGQDCQIF
jgi:hypothetical protein